MPTHETVSDLCHRLGRKEAMKQLGIFKPIQPPKPRHMGRGLQRNMRRNRSAGLRGQS